jgi:hypothetical protein
VAWPLGGDSFLGLEIGSKRADLDVFVMGGRIMCKYKTIALIALIAALLLVPVTQAVADTMKFRMVTSHTKVEIIKVVGVEEHIIAIIDSPGLASFDNGEVAVLEQQAYADYVKGAGIHKAYFRLTFEDGSVIDYTQEGTTRPDPNGKGSLFVGTCKITDGSGRYSGIQGKGSYTGRRVVSLNAGARLYADVTLTYDLP